MPASTSPKCVGSSPGRCRSGRTNTPCENGRPELDARFLAFVAFIRQEGVVKPWPREASKPRYHHTYLELDEWEYWTMEEAIAETTLINRALIRQHEVVPSPNQVRL